jgi:hypothetical protein
MNARHRALVLALALALRLFVALTRTDRHWPDEHYQTLEPAYFIVHGHGVLAWEWLQGFRSWLLPLVHVPLVAIAALFGARGGLAVTHLVRTVYAVADLVVLTRFVEFVIARRPFAHERHRARAHALSLSTLLLLPTIILWSPSSLQDHLASLLFYGAIPTVYRAIESDRPSRWALAGSLLTLPVTIKLQCAPLSLGTMLTALFLRSTAQRARIATALALGALGVAVLSALVDQWTFGSFAATTIHQLAYGESISRLFGTAPPWGYLTSLPELIGYDGIALVLALSVLSIARAQPVPRTLDPLWLIAPGAIALLLALSAIPHKEPRFALPIVPTLIVSLFNRRSVARLDVLPSRLAMPALVTVTLWSFATVRTEPIGLSGSDVSLLEEHIRRTRPNATHPVSICLFGPNWSQLRGALGVGGPVRYLDELDFAHPGMALRQCDFALVRQERLPSFETALRADPRRWVIDGPEQNDCRLYRTSTNR